MSDARAKPKAKPTWRRASDQASRAARLVIPIEPPPDDGPGRGVAAGLYVPNIQAVANTRAKN
jgi:hypothetical protein